MMMAIKIIKRMIDVGDDDADGAVLNVKAHGRFFTKELHDQ